METTATTNPEDKNQQEAEEPKATKENEKETKTKKKENEELLKLQKELGEKKECYLRLAAEYDNFRKRSSKEKLESFSDAKVSIIKEIVPLMDNFERANQNFDSESAEEYKKGIDMIFKQFSDAFEKLGVETFGEVHDKFDPNLHNAVMHEENKDFGENEICEVLQKGYKVGNKIIRTAMVRVAN